MLVWTGNWWALALRGGLAILLGIIAFALPVPTLAAIVILFGAYVTIDGVLALIAAVRGMREHASWGAMLVVGAVSIVAGVIALFWPGIGALALVYLVAAWALVTGALEIAMALRLRHVISSEWLLILGGVVSIALAIMVAAFPGAGALVLVWWLGAYAFAYGIIVLALALRLRHYPTVAA